MEDGIMGRESGWCPHCCLIRSKHCRYEFEVKMCDERKAYLAERAKLVKELKRATTGPMEE
jgi:hypothetical protein